MAIKKVLSLPDWASAPLRTGCGPGAQSPLAPVLDEPYASNSLLTNESMDLRSSEEESSRQAE